MRPIFTILLLSISLCYVAAQELIGGTNYNKVTVTTSSSSSSGSGEQTINESGLSPNLNSSSRFLGQATLGADYEHIVSTADEGFETWIDDQFNQSRLFSLKDYVQELTDQYITALAADGEDTSDVGPRREFWRFAWWQYTMTSSDLLRNRVALALSEILVISEMPDLTRQPLGLASYYDLLLNHSFENYRDILFHVSMHPTMGEYLTHLKNDKTNREKNRFPDENYAREIQQLFSIGLYELNQDGTQKLDGNGNPIPAYDNEDIAEFAKIFTGLSWGDSDQFRYYGQVDTSYTIPMKMHNRNHEPGAKFLLNGQVVPNRNPPDGMADVNDAIDNLFNHPNTGPFVARRLIQRLVKSNPTPEYIARIAAKFANNGSGIRGDMKAIIKAILLDPEARDCALKEDVAGGMLREPIVRYTQVNRAFNASNAYSEFYNKTNDFKANTEQRPLSSPSVFNFFQPDYQPIGAIADMGLFAPEFQITNSLSTVGYASEAHIWTFDEKPMEYGAVYGDYDQERQVRLDLEEELQLVNEGKINELVERFNLILAHGQLSERTKEVIVNTVFEIPDTQPKVRLHMALFLTLMSPDYLILR
ncbi:MAG: DUF1800 family protein [Bacteroidota bacterium]